MKIEDLMACYCKTREISNFYSRCLEKEGMTNEDKEIIYELLLNSVNSSNKLKKYCEKNS
ncbi:hypothetical protein [Gracilibacillus thailandensis]|uniref:Uncharacterized protein n=1 Tax=Gracilibacillus thailandensis TaxID=563735 RepID=A0A6N7QW17_9BACI|nr:hypothetical protein [Gracilibacillus thailandensis]MRI66208.1 hypothetical protein [Gracilibacillus thailandensis]